MKKVIIMKQTILTKIKQFFCHHTSTSIQAETSIEETAYGIYARTLVKCGDCGKHNPKLTEFQMITINEIEIKMLAHYIMNGKTIEEQKFL